MPEKIPIILPGDELTLEMEENYNGNKGEEGEDEQQPTS